MDGLGSNVSASGSASRSSRPSEDEGDSKPPPSFRATGTVTNKAALRLNTPQAVEGTEQAGTAGSGVAALPQNSSPQVSMGKWTAPGSEDESDVVDGFTEDGPVRAAGSHSSSSRATSAPIGVRASNIYQTRMASPAARTTRPAGTAAAAARRSAPSTTIASGVPAAAATDIEINEEAPAPTEEGPAATSSPSEDDKKQGIPKKYIYLGIIGVLVLVLIIVVSVLVSRNNNDPPPSPSTSSTGGPPTGGPPTAAPAATLAAIGARASLKCGIALHAGFASNEGGGAFSGFGFASNEGDSEYSGFDVDLCRAVAAGIMGPDAAVEYIIVDPTTRFEALQNKEVDLLASVTTFTMERNVHEEGTGVGYSFSIPYYYAGVGFAGVPPFTACADQLQNVTGDCEGLKICVRDGTTHVDRVKELLPDAGIILSPNLDAYYATFSDGLCNVMAGEPVDIAEAVVRDAGYVGDYEVGKNSFSKEPLALVTRADDPQFSDFVNWILQGLLAAEEQDIMQSSASSFAKSTVFGKEYETMFIDAVAAVGNYGEVYDRSLGQVIPRAEINKINQGDTALIYAFPFGSLLAEGPGPVSGGTLETIIQRGHLRCGITRRAVFAEFDTVNQEWRGLDVDFCKAVSAAIFNGVTGTIVYTVLPATERFVALQEGNVDLLARITTLTLERDVLEPNAGAGFTFSQPNFYDGLSFGGIPPYGQCADNLDVVSTECQDLLICVNDGTTFLERLKELLPERYIAPQQTGELAIQGLASGFCNAIAGGVQDVSPTSVVEVGEYTGSYENGVNRFSKDPLALVTRQDDHQWSTFVYWIVSAIFYAEEAGITQSTASRMPILNLFGPLYSRMLRDVVEAVGSYSEIYERNAEDQIPRGGLNLLNANPYGPQQYPYPGI